MIAVVTGSSGFIGRNLVERLLRDGHTVRCLVRPHGGPAPDGCARFVVDYSNPRSLQATAAFDGADTVFHLAGITTAVRPSDFRQGNVAPTRALLGALVAGRHRPRFVYVSSQAAAGPASSLTRPVDESDPPRPVEAYGASKLEAERVVASFTDRLATTIVRPCAVFGPRDRDFLRLFRMARRGILVYPGIRDHWLSVLHVGDVVEGLLTAATHPRGACRSFFLTSERPVQWRDIGHEIAGLAGGVRELDVPRPLVRAASTLGEIVARVTGKPTLASRSKVALTRDPFWVCSGALARSEIGFAPRQSLPEAIRETYLWYDENGWLGRPPRGRAAPSES